MDLVSFLAWFWEGLATFWEGLGQHFGRKIGTKSCKLIFWGPGEVWGGFSEGLGPLLRGSGPPRGAFGESFGRLRDHFWKGLGMVWVPGRTLSPQI